MTEELRPVFLEPPARPPAEEIRAARFEPAGVYASRVRCTVCGARGYPHDGPRGSYPQWWGWTHLGEHVPCPVCSRPFTRGAGLAAHRRACRPAGHEERGRGIGLA